jgi:hypothetical protein
MPGTRHLISNQYPSYSLKFIVAVLVLAKESLESN